MNPHWQVWDMSTWSIKETIASDVKFALTVTHCRRDVLCAGHSDGTFSVRGPCSSNCVSSAACL